MKKFISLVLALVMALSLTTIAWGANTIYVSTTGSDSTGDGSSANPYATFLKAASEAAEGDTIMLTAGNHGDLGTLGTVAKNLSIVGADGAVATFLGFSANDYGTVTIKNIDFEDDAVVWCSICIEGKGDFTIEDCTFTTTSDGSAIYLSDSFVDSQKLTVKKCAFDSVYGEAAIVIQNAVTTDDCVVNISENDFSEVEGDSVGVWCKDSTVDLNSDVNTVAMVNTADQFEAAVAASDAGDSIKLMADVTVTDVVIDKPITINENGNTLTGLTAGAGVTTDASGKVNGGTFASAPANVADGYEAVYTNGAYMVVPKTSAAGTTTTLKDADKYDIYPVAGTTSVKAAKADITKKVTSNVSVTADGKTTTTYTATTYSDGTNVYVEVDASIATYKLMQGNTIVAYMVNLADVGYVPTTTKVATAFVEAKKAADQVCGDNTVDGYVIDGKTYVAGGANWAVLNGKFVSYTDTVVAKVPHTYADATYSAKDKSVTSVKCTACKVTWNVLTAKQVAVMAPASYTTATTASGTYFIPTGAVANTPAGDKVESAETFDAGIAMYVGMSVMAAAGSAVVLKKKD